jgi:preprotein translocase subunit SecA
LKKIIEKIIGSYSSRELKKIYPIIDQIENMDDEYSKLSDDELKNKTLEFKERLKKDETLDDILPEAFATVREAAWRVLGMKHFRVQLIGGIVLHQGRISEMKTGEGKTLVATLPVYLNALEGKGVHVVTVNDYLAKRDSEWMGKVYKFLGLKVGLIVHDMNHAQKKEAYNTDVTYATNNELGFDYLRDNMVTYKKDMVQREINYAIVDEVDSILVDEARTPLIISGAGDKSTELYNRTDAFVKRLKAKYYIKTDDKEHNDDIEEDYIVDEKAHTVVLTKNGLEKAERYFNIDNLSDPENITISHHVNQSLKAYGLMKNEREYVVKEGEIIIVDEFTGRLMYGRRYSDGLHQAIEAKENVKVERESKTLATITFQNFFRMYNKLAGMTGTALTEEQEFQSIYSLDVIVIPTNKEMAREDLSDVVYKNEKGKFNAVVEDIIENNKRGRPVLVGTITIDKSELLSKVLKRRGVKHQVLNAKYHEKEAEIIAQAGKFGAVTISTNMAGRGTDIVLGGNPEFMAKQEMKKLGHHDDVIAQLTSFEDTNDSLILDARAQYKQFFDKFKKDTDSEKTMVKNLGGLHIIGTERHESRRIDNQLRGRSGRQGDPGSTRFYISLEDDLMRLFGSDRLNSIVSALGLGDDDRIEHKMLTGVIENAQKRVEGKNFAIRKSVLQFDDVMNKQREVIYEQRRKVLDGENIKSHYQKMLDTLIDNIVDSFCADEYPDNWDWESMIPYAERIFLAEGELDKYKNDLDNIGKELLREEMKEIAIKRYEEKEEELDSEVMRELERVVLLKMVDQRWMNHIDEMDQLRQGIYLRSYGQRDPVIEYKFEGFNMFEEMIKNIQEDAVKIVLNSHKQEDRKNLRREQIIQPISASHGQERKKPKVVKKKIGRNDKCSCGSGKKYKNCCGA